MWDATFTWAAPGTPSWRGGPGLSVLPAPGGPALGLEEDTPLRTYSLADYPALYRTFADVAPDLNGVLAFAAEYGLLLTRLEQNAAGDPEFVAAWVPRIAWMKHLVGLWDQGRPGGGDGSGLRDLVRWDGVYIEVREPDVGEGPHVPNDWRGRAWWSPKLLSYTMAEDEPKESRPAIAYVVERLSEELGHVRHPRLAVQRSSSTFRVLFRSRPANLWEAMLLQFATAVTEGTRYRRCAACGRWLEYKTEMGREDRTACSPKCRQRIFLQRKEEVRQLGEQGVQPEEIARRLDTDIGTVRKWLAPKRGK